MNTSFFVDTSVSAAFNARRNGSYSKLGDPYDLQTHASVVPPSTTETKKSRHERYASELYFADDDLTEPTVHSDLSWYWSSASTSQSSSCYHPLRVRTYAMDQGEIECILLLNDATESSASTYYSDSLSTLSLSQEEWGDQVDDDDDNDDWFSLTDSRNDDNYDNEHTEACDSSRASCPERLK